jgi:hypothetical protein
MLKRAWHDESDDDDTPLPPLKNGKQRGESDDDDTPIRPKKISKPQSEPDDASDSSSESDHDDTPPSPLKNRKPQGEPDDSSDSSSVSSSDGISVALCGQRIRTGQYEKKARGYEARLFRCVS